MSEKDNVMIDDFVLKVKSILNDHYITIIDQQFNLEVDQMNEIIAEINSYQVAQHKIGLDQNNEAVKHKSNLSKKIDAIWQVYEKKEFTELYLSFSEPLTSALAELPVSKKLVQKKLRFEAVETDSSYIKLLKSVKSFGFKLNKLPLEFSNLFRKEKVKISYWKHKIPVRNLASQHFQSELITSLKSITDLYFAQLCKQYLDIKKWDDAVSESSTNQEKSTFEFKSSTLKKGFTKTIKENLDSIIETQTQNFKNDFYKAGTIELPSKKLLDTVITKNTEDAEIEWSDNNYQWKNTIFSLFEEWRSDIDIYTLKHKTLSHLQEFQSAQLKSLAEQIDPEINEIKSFIEASKKTLEGSSDNIQIELKKINFQANRVLDKELVPSLCNKLSGKLISNLLNKVEIGIKRNVEALSNEYTVAKTNTYDQPIKADDLVKVSPYELISYETLSAFQEALGKIKKELFTTLESTTNDTKDLDHIITFSFASAIATLDSEEVNTDSAVKIAQDGLDRALNRLLETREKLTISLENNSKLLEEAINQFCSSIMELTVNENIRELNLRIKKAKVAKQAELVKKQVKEKILNRRLLIINSLKNSYSRASHFLNSVGDKFILTAGKPIITKQISDFLLGAQEAIDELPLIYQKLYKIEPVDDLELFEGRQKEFDSVMQAYHSWKKGRFAATAILSEKWGGLTSFINYTVDNASFTHPVIRLTTTENINSEEKLIEVLKTLFKNDTFENLDQVVEFLDTGSKRIIILEDLQKLYLRKVGGFSALQLISQLISRTYKNVFWITTTTIYSWTYLSKTININDFFSYIIPLEELTKDQMVNMIWKRNRISGFNINFEVGEKYLDHKKFNNLEAAEQQTLLKEEFFTELNGFAKSNVSLALIFWLLSTKKVDENTITIGAFKKPELNFLSSLSMDKVQMLHGLIIHDGLNERQLSETLNLTEASCRLTILTLLEDGIIFKKENVYLVNPIIYRSTISLLKAKNLIH